MFSRRSADLNLNFLLDFHQAAVDSVGKTDLPPLKHPGKVYYFHQKEGEDQYQIFKLDGQCLETQEDLLQKYWAKFWLRTSEVLFYYDQKVIVYCLRLIMVQLNH